MKSILFIFIAFVFSSCVEAPLGDATYTTLFNQSNHDIELQTFRGGEFLSSSIIENNQSIEFKFASGDPGGPTGSWVRPLKDADSIWIIYFEEASIWHTTDANSPVSKSLMLESSYIGGKTGDTKYEFTYTFTPEDFEEALEFGD